MNICSIPYLGGFAFFALIYQLLPGPWGRRLLLSLLNLAFLASFVPNPRSAAILVIFLAGSYGLIRLVRIRPSGLLVGLGIGLVVAAFLVVKHYSFVPWVLPRWFWAPLATAEVVGLSYMLFKFIHVLIDTWQNQIPSIDFYCYLNYQLAFFTLLAGPIQRYSDFSHSWQEMDFGEQDERESLLAWNRLLTGMIKMGLVAPLLGQVFDLAGGYFGSQAPAKLFLRFAIYFYTYPLYLFFNFSGYTDIVLGCGRLLGFRLPENFDRPYLARNIIDFWNRWHISLTQWIRDYVFMTSYKATVERYPAWGSWLGYGLLFMALFLAGVWHGATAGFAVFGMLHGLGAALNQAYGDVLKRRLGRSGYQSYLKNRWIHALAIVLTLHYFCFSMLYFSSGIERANDILRAVGAQLLAMPALIGNLTALGLAFGFVALVLLEWLALGKMETAIAKFQQIGTWITTSTSKLYTVVALESAFLVIVLIASWALAEKDAVVVYLRF